MLLLSKNGADDEPPTSDCGACEQRDRLLELAEIHRSHHLDCIVVQMGELSNCVCASVPRRS